MPIIEKSAEQHEIERREELEDLAWAAEREDSREQAKRRHELELARLKAAIPQRHKTITRVGLAIAKLPALIVLALMLPLLVLAGKDLPTPLTSFMEL